MKPKGTQKQDDRGPSIILIIEKINKLNPSGKRKNTL